MAFLGLTAADAALGGSALSAGANIFGGILGASGQSATNAQQLSSQMQSEQFNAQQAQLNRDFQERMSSTAYQRAMSDMRAAGLNPILAANLGGASTPGGASASISGVSGLGNPGSSLQQGISSAGQVAQNAAATKATLNQADKDASATKMNESGTALNDAATEVKKVEKLLTENTASKVKVDEAHSAAQVKVAEENAANLRASTANTNIDTANKLIDSEIKKHDVNSAKNRADISETEAWNKRNVGSGHAADTLTTGVRSLGTTLKGVTSGYTDYIGKPFSDAVHGIIDHFRSK